MDLWQRKYSIGLAKLGQQGPVTSALCMISADTLTMPVRRRNFLGRHRGGVGASGSSWSCVAAGRLARGRGGNSASSATLLLESVGKGLEGRTRVGALAVGALGFGA